MTAKVTLAAVAGAHGIGGEVRLKLFAETLDSLKRYTVFDADGRTLTLKSLRPDKIGAVARFAEINDRNAAEALRGTVLSVARAALPPLAEGEYYHADVIGLAVFTTGGEAIGHVRAIENYGAGDIIDVERPDGRTFMVALTGVAAPEIGETVVIDEAWLR